MAVPELNEDVLTAVCDFLTGVSDVLAVSLTCSSFRPIAIRRLLSIHHIYLNWGSSICRFHTFLFADAPARAAYIDALEVDIDIDIEVDGGTFSSIVPQPSDVSLFIDIITSCKRLEHVSFACASASRRLNEDQSIIEAVASVPSLRSLSFSSNSADALSFVRKVNAPLRELYFWCYFADKLPDNPDGEFHWYPVAFQDSLLHLAQSLEVLGFHRLIVDPNKFQELQNTNIPVPPFSSWMQYPAVRSLSVNHLRGRLLLEPLQHLFPALDGTFSLDHIRGPYPEDVLSAMRVANQRAQKNAGAWRKLDRVICPAAAFYILGLRCPVRHAILNFSDMYYDTEVVQRCVTESLSENPVPRLTLYLTLDYGLGIIRGLPPPELKDKLTHLALELDAALLDPYAAPFSWNELLDAVLASLRPLHRLAHLRIAVRSSYPVAQITDTDAECPPPPRPVLGPTARPLHALHWHPSTFDFQGTAALLVRQLPSLQSLLLTTRGSFLHRTERRDGSASLVPTDKRWCVSRGWRRDVAPTGADSARDGTAGEPVLVEEHDTDAEASGGRGERILPDAYEAWLCD